MDSIATLQDLLPRFKRFGERPAVIAFAKDRKDEWTYSKLADEASRLATGLAKAGIEPGEYLALWAENSPQWLAACLGVLGSGAVAVPLDTQLDDQTLSHALCDSAARYVFTSERLLQRLERLATQSKCKPILLSGESQGVLAWKEFAAEPSEPAVKVAPDDRALLFYTSGTTGPPKGVPLTHRNLAFQLNTLLAADLVTSDDRILLPLPLHHVYPFTIGMLTPLALGLPIVLPYTLTGPQLMRALREGGVTMIIGVPRLYRALFTAIESRARAAGRLSSGLFRLALSLSTALAQFRIRIGRQLFGRLHRETGSQLRVLASGGAALDADLARNLEGLGWLVGTGYGLTETSPLLTLDKPGWARLASVGRPIEGVELRIDPVGDRGQESGVSGQKSGVTTHTTHPPEGEVVARGPSVFAGYHNLPEKTKEAFTQDGWFRTGDLGYIDQDGFLFITGRVKTLIVLEGGEKVQPDGLEEAFQESPAIGEIGVLEREKKLVAVVRPDRSSLGAGAEAKRSAEDAVRRALEERSRSLASYQRISHFVLTDSPLPRTRLGKVRREELKELYEQLQTGKHEPERAGPIAEEEMTPDDRVLLEDPVARKTWEWLAQRFSEQRITPDTSPQLDLAIDSLEWLNLTLELRQRCGIELSEDAIGRIHTLRDLLREAAELPEAKGGAPAADPLQEPDKILGDERQGWLAPLSRVEAAAGWCLYVLDWLLVRSAFRVHVKGRENLPKEGPFVLAPNHISYLDSYVLATTLDYKLLRNTYWAGWSGIAFGPVFRVLRRLCHVVPIDPDRAAASSLAFGAAVLQDKHNLVWYPEGTHSKTGKLMKLRPGIGMLLNRYPAPVVPVHLQGTRESLPEGRYIPRPGRIEITFGSPLDPRKLAKEGQGDEPYERITNALHDEMAEMCRS